MTDPADLRFFRALKDVCGAAEGVDRSCRDAIDRALETGDPLDMQAAHKALKKLDDPLKGDILRQVHLRMVSDLSAIWDSLPGVPGSGWPN